MLRSNAGSQRFAERQKVIEPSRRDLVNAPPVERAVAMRGEARDRGQVFGQATASRTAVISVAASRRELSAPFHTPQGLAIATK